MKHRTCRTPARQHGFVLIAAMVMLIVLSVLAISMYHNFTVQERMAGNSREKGRAFQMAQGALQYAEYELATVGPSNMNQSSACTTGAVPASTLTICSGTVNATVVNPSTVGGAMTMTNGWTYTTPSITVSSTAPSNNSYYAYPQLFIRYLGTTNNQQNYLITALGYGATARAVAVVQSTFSIKYSTTNLGNP